MIRSAVAIFCLAAALLGLWAAIPEDPPPAAVDQVGEQEAEVVAEASVVEVVAAGETLRRMLVLRGPGIRLLLLMLLLPVRLRPMMGPRRA